MTSPAERVTLNMTAQNLLRILIASYFLAVGLNLIPGTDLSLLTKQLLPEHVAVPLAAMLVFALAFMVMIGMFMRPAALVLGLLTFFASYLRMIELGVEDELGTFWRDLVLVAALMLTYAENAPRDYQMRRAIRRTITPRRIRPAPQSEPRLRIKQPGSVALTNAQPVTSKPKAPSFEVEPEFTNIFADPTAAA